MSGVRQRRISIQDLFQKSKLQDPELMNFNHEEVTSFVEPRNEDLPDYCQVQKLQD